MSDTKFTPGPWSIYHFERQIVICGKDGQYDLAIVRKIGSENNEANARVMNAAPRMYEALEDIVKWVDLPHSDGWDTPRGLAIKEAEMALRQARGEDA